MWAFVAIKGPSPSNKAAAGAASGDRKGAYASGMLGKQGAQLLIVDLFRETYGFSTLCSIYFDGRSQLLQIFSIQMNQR